MPEEDEGVRYARKACLPCRTSKRRCDRKLPGCDLCSRKEVECSYPGPRQSKGHLQLTAPRSPTSRTPESQTRDDHTSPSGGAHLDALASLGLSRSVESDANAIYFLAPHIFQQARLELPRPDLPIPAAVSSVLGDASSIRNIATDYFRTVHRWLPIVSKRGFFAYLLNPLARKQTELSLLAICMKLCCTPHPRSDGEGADGAHLYHTAKRFYYEAETKGALSIHTLQAGILIAFYELAHAIYPAAYLSVGGCARYGLALRVDRLTGDWAGNADGLGSWIEVEERRRAWWAVLMLDRFSSLSNPSRPLSTADPPFDAFLPVDDAAWDNWSNPGDGVRMSNGFELEMGSFARLSQATYLLGQALRSICALTAERDRLQPDELAQLRRTLLALVYAADSEATVRRLEFCAQSALSLSTILLLEEHRWQGTGSVLNENEHTNPSLEALWQESRTALDRLAAAALSYNTHCPTTPDAPHIVPVFLIHVMYQLCCIYLKLSKASPEGEVRERIETTRLLLRRISLRWRLAGVYLNILDAQEITISSETIETRLSFYPTRFEPEHIR